MDFQKFAATPVGANPPTAPVDETDTTLGSIDLSKVDLPLQQRHFRFPPD